MKRRTKVRKPARKAPSRAVAMVKEPPAPVLRTGNQALDELLVLARAASDPRCDPTKMVVLRDMITDIRRERREEAFTRDFLEMQGKLPEINQDGKIEITPKETARSQKQVTRFATFANIHHAVMPVLTRHNFILWHQTNIGAGGVGIVVETFLKHTQGHHTSSVIALVLDTTGSKNNNQGAGSSSSYGKRYNTIALLNIVSRAMDDADLDGHTAERVVRKVPLEATQNPGLTSTQNPAPTEATVEVVEEAASVVTIDMEQAQKLSTAIVDCGVPAHLFKAKYGEPAELPAARFSEAMQACTDYKRRMSDSQKMASAG